VTEAVALQNYLRVDLQSVEARVHAMGVAVAGAELSVEAEEAGATFCDGYVIPSYGVRVTLRLGDLRVAVFFWPRDHKDGGPAYYARLRELGERFAAALAAEAAAS
jgi:hypothetical protein